MDNKYEQRSQVLELINRNEFKINDCTDIHSFNEENVLLQTGLGLLTINGVDLHITNLNLDQGEVTLTGNIDTLAFSDDEGFMDKGAGFFSRLFR